MFKQQPNKTLLSKDWSDAYSITVISNKILVTFNILSVNINRMYYITLCIPKIISLKIRELQ